MELGRRGWHGSRRAGGACGTAKPVLRKEDVRLALRLLAGGLDAVGDVFGRGGKGGHHSLYAGRSRSQGGLKVGSNAVRKEQELALGESGAAQEARRGMVAYLGSVSFTFIVWRRLGFFAAAAASGEAGSGLP